MVVTVFTSHRNRVPRAATVAAAFWLEITPLLSPNRAAAESLAPASTLLQRAATARRWWRRRHGWEATREAEDGEGSVLRVEHGPGAERARSVQHGPATGITPAPP